MGAGEEDDSPDAGRYIGATPDRHDTLIGMRNCLEYLVQEARDQDLNLTQWLLRMTIASLDEALTTASQPGGRLDLIGGTAPDPAAPSDSPGGPATDRPGDIPGRRPRSAAD